jgi:putative aldouronate transport system substrate-binding protein
MICNYDTTGNIISGAMENTAPEAFADCYGFDVLAQNIKVVYVDDNGTVGSWFETEDYKTIIERVHDWYEKGYVYKDSATSADTGDTMMANGVTFSFSTMSEYGVEVAKKNATGYDLVVVPIVEVPVQTQNGNTWAWSVPVTSENPEAAVAFMNLMWTNADIMNLLVWGIEGRDYEVNAEGEAVLLPTKEYQSGDWWFGNQFLAYPAEGNGGDFRVLALADMLSASMSPYYGCVVDTSGIANEITAVSNVLTQYEPALESGTIDPADSSVGLDVMISALHDAGLDIVLAEYQAQLDAWLAQQ